MVHFFTLMVFSASLWAQSFTPPLTPNEKTTPGAFCSKSDSDFSGYRSSLKYPFCKRSVSTGQKRRIYAAYGVPSNCEKFYTIDHLVPLSIGGNNSPQNLWPEHVEIKKQRRDLEQQLFDSVMAGRISQKQATDEILKAKFNPPFTVQWKGGCQ